MSLQNQIINKDIFVTEYIEKYQQKLYWFIRRLVVHHQDADDILQNVFIKAWQGIEKFRGESKLQTWLYSIASNEVFTHFAKNKKRTYLGLNSEITDYCNLVKASEGFDFKKLEWRLQLAIQKLPKKQKLVFCLRYFDEMPYKQMAKIFLTTESSLKASYHHAAVKVEKFLKENNYSYCHR